MCIVRSLSQMHVPFRTISFRLFSFSVTFSFEWSEIITTLLQKGASLLLALIIYIYTCLPGRHLLALLIIHYTCMHECPSVLLRRWIGLQFLFHHFTSCKWHALQKFIAKRTHAMWPNAKVAASATSSLFSIAISETAYNRCTKTKHANNK